MKGHIRAILAFLLLAISLPAVARDRVPVTEEYFPDENFRKLLINQGSATNTYNKGAYDAATNEIIVSKYKNLDLGPATGRPAIINTGIKSVEGIKNLEALEILRLASPGAAASKFEIEEIDVSGMQYLKAVMNDYRRIEKYYQAGDNWNTATGQSIASGNGLTALENPNNFKLKRLIAENCPSLTYVGVAYYYTCEYLSLAGSDNVTDLQVTNSGIRHLDLSNLKGLSNTHRIMSSGSQNDYSGSGYKSNLVMEYCENLESIEFGENCPLKQIRLVGCDKLDNVDLSKLNLEVFSMTGGTKTVGTKTVGTGTLSNIIIGDQPNLIAFKCPNNRVRKLDESLLKTCVTVDVSNNLFTKFDVSALKKATRIDVSGNHLYKIGTPAISGSTMKSYKFLNNHITEAPDLSKIPTNITYYPRPQYRYVGDAYRYKIFDDPASAERVAKEKIGNIAQAPEHGHIGDPAAGEDPCYFYFTDPSGNPQNLTEGTYWLEVGSNRATTQFRFMEVHLIRDGICADESYDFFLSGDKVNGWAPDESHRFALADASKGLYTLSLTGDFEGDFRIWDDMNPVLVENNFGGVESDLDEETGFRASDWSDISAHAAHRTGHVFAAPEKTYALGEDTEKHWSTSVCALESEDHQPVSRTYTNPTFELRFIPGDHENNYMRITGVPDIPSAIDLPYADDNEMPVYYNMQGVRVDHPCAGIYLKQQGPKVEKIAIR